jgi:molybdopterin converting factor small subunit
MLIKVKMFGAFRALGDAVELELSDPATVAAVRDALAVELPGDELRELLSLSKFADEKEVLREAAICDPGQILAILPPVSGG